MSLGAASILNAVTSYAASTGLFDAVNGHEPKSAPGSGLCCAVWVDRIAPVNSSGLASTSVRLDLMVRIYTSMLQRPADAIEIAVADATDVLMTALLGDFDLGGNARAIDVRGSDGAPFNARAGYFSQDNQAFRVMDINLGVILNDVWTEVA